MPPTYATIHARAQRCDDRVPRGLHAAVFVSISHRQCVSLKRPTASSARLQPLLVCSLCLYAASREGVVPAHQGNDRSEPPLRPLDYLPLKNNVSHGHGRLAAHVSVFARAPGDVKSIGSPRRRRNTRTSCLNTNAHRPLLIACVARGRDDATTPPSQDGDRSKPCGRALVFGRPRRVGTCIRAPTVQPLEKQMSMREDVLPPRRSRAGRQLAWIVRTRSCATSDVDVNARCSTGR